MSHHPRAHVSIFVFELFWFSYLQERLPLCLNLRGAVRRSASPPTCLHGMLKRSMQNCARRFPSLRSLAPLRLQPPLYILLSHNFSSACVSQPDFLWLTLARFSLFRVPRICWCSKEVQRLCEEERRSSRSFMRRVKALEEDNA